MKTLSNEEALSRAAHLCVQAERAPKEIYKKLLTWGITSSQAEKIVCQLKKEKYVDEARFAHAFVHDKFEYEHWGKIKIAYHLRDKGISDSIISLSIDEVISDENYLSSAIYMIRSKMRGMSLPLCENDRAKIFRFAAQRGYDSNTISRALQIVKENSQTLE